MVDLLLGIDVGTTSVKVALFAVDGTLHAVHTVEYPLFHLRPGWVEQYAQDWWNATCVGIQAVLAAVPDGAARVAGASVSAQAPTLLAVDEQGEALRPALIWMDRRAEAEAMMLAEQFGQALFERTGNRADAFYVAAKLLWLKHHEPDTLRHAHQFLNINGYIAHHLCGVFSLDPAHAALMQLQDRFSGAWWPELCAYVGVEPRQLPPVLPAHAILGGVTQAAAALTGLRAGTPVLVGTVDGAAAALEAGVVEPGAAADMTGTSTVVLMTNTTPAIHPALIAMPHAAPGLHLLLGAMATTGASLRWFRDQLAAPEAAQAAASGGDVFDAMTEAAAQIAPGEGGLFLPYMAGERSPLWHTDARGVFFGLSLATPRAAMIRAVLEGTAFALRHNLDVARAAGMAVTEVRAVGGGSRSAVWLQIKADVLGLPVLEPVTSVGAPFGDALLVGLGVGLWDDIAQAARERVRIQRVFEPDLRRHAHYTELYGVYRELYLHVRADFDALAAIQSEFSAGVQHG